jgi:6-pyruvoyltetrahydropterin/6-carboxytetrahydropterin synthase
MYELKIISNFAAAHQLREYEGRCERLHGHNWKVEVCVKGEEPGNDGLLVDFRVIKEKTKNVIDELDHEFLNELKPFKILNPSSENIARHIFESLSLALNNDMIKVSKVSVWESDTACASYSSDG